MRNEPFYTTQRILHIKISLIDIIKMKKNKQRKHFIFVKLNISNTKNNSHRLEL